MFYFNLKSKTTSRFTVGVFIFIFLALLWQIKAAAAQGEKITLTIDPEYALTGQNQAAASLRYVGRYAYFYVEDAWWDNQSGNKTGILENLAYEFDQIIYPNLRNAYGSEWIPGIDGEARIFVLLAPLKDDTGGYFNTHDGYPKSIFPDSNEKEIIYLNALYLDSSRMRGFLAHEFQHLISFYQKDKLNNRSDEVWLNEARSEYAPTLAGYDTSFAGSNLEKKTSDFLAQPNDSLTEWRNRAWDYAAANLFTQYLIEHYGRSVLTKITINPKIGIDSINDALSYWNFKENFLDVFGDWVIALFLNDCKAGTGQKYCFFNEDLRNRLKPAPTSSYILPSSGISAIVSASLTKDWTPRWYTFSGGNQNLKLEFKGNTNGKFRVGYIVNKLNGDNEVKFFNLNDQQFGAVYIPQMGTEVKSVTLAPFSYTKMSGFTSEELFYSFSYSATIVPEIPVETPSSSQPIITAPSYPNGSLIRAVGDYKAYIIQGQYKRWIQNSVIFNFYSHLKWENIIEVTPAERDWYGDAWLIRADGDFRVYEMNGDGTKHWLNMTAEQFTRSGRKWEMISVINRAERDWYRTGADVLFR